jgi:hypothetical protein
LLNNRYNIAILTQELKAAGISTAGNCSDTGVVWSDDGKQIQTRPDVVAILEAHDPDAILPQPPTFDERLEALELVTDMLMDGGA